MINSTYYHLSDGKQESVETDRLGEVLEKSRTDGVLWLDIKKPDDADIDLLGQQFHIHPIAMEDIRHKKQRPRVVDYGKYIFFVLYEIDATKNKNNSSNHCIRKGAELHLFAGANFFISVHDGSSKLLDAARKRWESAGEQQKLGPYYLLYLLLDTVTDAYFPALDKFDEYVEELEDRITGTENAAADEKKVKPVSDSYRRSQSDLVELRHNLIMMRRIVSPLRDAVNVLLRRVEAFQEEDTTRQDKTDAIRSERARQLFAYFQDIYDHAIRLVDTIDTYRDILSSLVDANLAVISNRTNDIMKVLTSVSIILMSIATITGWYGMNFANMPELHGRYSYAIAATVMLSIGVAEWLYFRKRRWL